MTNLRPADVGRIARGQSTRAALVAQARALLLDRGVENTSLQLVATAAGVSIGAIQGHFGTKDGLILAVYAELLVEERERGRRLLIDAAASSDPPAAMVRSLWSAVGTDRHDLLLQVEHRAARDPDFATDLQRSLAGAPSVLQELAAVFGHDDPAVSDRANVIVMAMVGVASMRHLLPDDAIEGMLRELETIARDVAE